MPKDKKTLKSITWASWACAISWFFWGPADAYYSLFLKQFGADYTQIGWLVSLSFLVPILISLPLGILADKISARKMVLVAMLLSLLTPLLNYVAGENSLIWLVAFIALLGGAFRIMRNVGQTAYVKKITPSELSIKTWVVFDSLTIGFWGLGLIAGSVFILFLSLNELFLLVIPGLLIQFLIYLFITKSDKHIRHELKHLHTLSLKTRLR